MNRTLISICMALCGISGVLIAFNVCISVIGGLRNPALSLTFAHIVGAVVAIGLIAGALALRRRLEALDARVEGPRGSSSIDH